MVPALLLVAWGWLATCAAAEKPANVLLVFSNSRLLPANIEVDRGLNEAAEGSPNVRFFAEFLDAPEFDGKSYEHGTAAYLKEKFAARAPQLIVGGGPGALDFLLRHRAQMFPGVPIVHVGVDRTVLEQRTLPADVIGIPAGYDYAGTLQLALRLHPRARRLVVVTGASVWGREREADIRADVAKLGLALPVEYLSGLPAAGVAARLQELAPDVIVFTPGYFRDGAGRTFTPRESVVMMAAASGAPVYVPFASQLGTGAVGGRMTSYVEMGRATRAIIDRIVEGAAVPSMAVPAALPAPVQLDWRQVRKWNIDADLIPADAVVHFREPTFWEAHRTGVIVAAAVMLLQAGLIVALLIERRLRRRTAAALVESERRISLAARAARLSTFVWDLARDRILANARQRERGGLSRQTSESFQQVLQAVYPADRDRFDVAVREAAANDRELDIEYRMLQPDGKVGWFAARGHAAAGEADRFTGVSMDITARKTAELQAEADRAALTHMSRVATMGQLSAAIAHQLNQPLAAILGNAETARKMLGRKDASLDELGEILDDIVVEDRRAAEVIRRLGALYRRGETESSTFYLNNLVRETLDLLRAELVMRHVTAVVELAASLPPVQGGRIQLQQVLLNLVLNASDAMSNVDANQRTVVIRTSFDGKRVQLCVVDRGTGIAAADLKRVFEPFWSTKATGLGVGLAICDAIISAHYGTLTAANNPEGGATFCFTLPVPG